MQTRKIGTMRNSKIPRDASLHRIEISFRPSRELRDTPIKLSPLNVIKAGNHRTKIKATGISINKDIESDFDKSLRRVRFAPKSSSEERKRVPSCTIGALSRVTPSQRYCVNDGASIDRKCTSVAFNQERSHLRSGCSSWQLSNVVSVPVTASPGVRIRIHPTGKYAHGTLSPTTNAAPAATSERGLLLKAAADGDDDRLRALLRQVALDDDMNTTDKSGRSILSHLASNGPADVIERILLMPGVDVNLADNEGNTPLHFAAQAGQADCLNSMLMRCKGMNIDAKNNMGFTALMKAALQGRNKCARMLLFAGANAALKDNGRGFRADQWARFCGRYVCADVIEKLARQKLLERSTSYGNWGSEVEISTRTILGKIVPSPIIPQTTGIKSKLKRVFRTSSGPGHRESSSARLITQLTTAALCASTPVLPTAPSVPPVVKSLIRPLTVPKLQITLVSGANNVEPILTSVRNNRDCQNIERKSIQDFEITSDKRSQIIQTVRVKKKNK